MNLNLLVQCFLTKKNMFLQVRQTHLNELCKSCATNCGGLGCFLWENDVFSVFFTLGEMKIVGCNDGDGDPHCHGVVYYIVYAVSVFFCSRRVEMTIL